jgi:hypothetical protein
MTNNENVKPIANKVLTNANIPEDQMFGSVIAILMVISIILTLVRVIQECNNNKLSMLNSQQDKYQLYGSEMRSYSIKRGWFTKMRIKKVLRNKLSREDYKQYGAALCDSILNTGEVLTDDEVITLVEASNV